MLEKREFRNANEFHADGFHEWRWFEHRSQKCHCNSVLMIETRVTCVHITGCKCRTARMNRKTRDKSQQACRIPQKPSQQGNIDFTRSETARDATWDNKIFCNALCGKRRCFHKISIHKENCFLEYNATSRYHTFAEPHTACLGNKKANWYLSTVQRSAYVYVTCFGVLRVPITTESRSFIDHDSGASPLKFWVESSKDHTCHIVTKQCSRRTNLGNIVIS